MITLHGHFSLYLLSETGATPVSGLYFDDPWLEDADRLPRRIALLPSRQHRLKRRPVPSDARVAIFYAI
jgi:hypothetical protein